MLYKYPKNLTLSQMAIWVDQNTSDDEVSQEKTFEYFYHIFNVLSKKYGLFKNYQDYDDFSAFAATQLFKRYFDKNQQPIRSCMNYIKKSLQPYKAQFQNQFYCENVSKEKLKNYDTRYDSDLEFQLIQQASGLNQCEFLVYLDDIAKTIQGCIKNIPKKKFSNEYINIYISCLLTFLDLITISKYDQEQLDNIQRSDKIRDNLYKSLYKIPKDYSPILYHLPQHYKNYVLFLVNKSRIAIKNDLNEIIYSQVQVQDLYKDLLDQYEDEDDF